LVLELVLGRVLNLVGVEKKPLVVVEALVLDFVVVERELVEVEGVRLLVEVWWWKVKEPLVIVGALL
jgi:hypothetical protein